MKKKKYIFLTIYLLLILIIFISSLRNSDASTNDSNFIVDIVIFIISIFKEESTIDVDLVSLIVRKLVGHFGSFCLCGIFGSFTFELFINKKANSIIFNILSGITIAVIAELLQLIPEGRSCQITDMLIDMSGYLFGFFINIIIIKFVKQKNITTS